MAGLGCRAGMSGLPTFVLRGGNATLVYDLLQLETGGDSHSSGVYSFEIFSAEFCSLFLDELEGYYASNLPISRPNSMNNYGESTDA